MKIPKAVCCSNKSPELQLFVIPNANHSVTRSEEVFEDFAPSTPHLSKYKKAGDGAISESLQMQLSWYSDAVRCMQYLHTCKYQLSQWALNTLIKLDETRESFKNQLFHPIYVCQYWQQKQPTEISMAISEHYHFTHEKCQINGVVLQIAHNFTAQTFY